VKTKQIKKSRKEPQRKMKRKISQENSLKSKRNEIHYQLKINSSRFYLKEEKDTRKIAFTKIKEAERRLEKEKDKKGDNPQNKKHNLSKSKHKEGSKTQSKKKESDKN